MKYMLVAAMTLLSTPVFALSGKVVNPQGEVIVGAVVEVVGLPNKLLTNAQGEFATELSAVDEVHVQARGYSHKVLHLHGTKTQITIVLYPSVIEEIDVIGVPLHASTMESAQPISVVAGDDLRAKQAATLGETLKYEVGVQASYFGPVASSPIIRGLDGPRVLITQNGLDVSDASRVGPDHVVATEASTAQQIEVLRGPATLFYGSGAIGGVVNIVDDRVPRSSDAIGVYSLAHNTVNREQEVSAAYTGGGNDLAFHVDGFWRDGDNYKIPGMAELESHADHQAEGHAEHSKGVLENSAAQSQGFNLGGSLLLDKGFVGLAYGRLERLNDIPGHSHHDEHEHDQVELAAHEEHNEHEESVQSDLTQDRWQLLSELQVDGKLLAGINTRLGYTDYTHVELENGAVGTRFMNKSAEFRLDFLQQELSGWRGALSVDAKHVDFSAVGEEAFTSPSITKVLALALMEEKHQGDFLWQLGARIERVTIAADALALNDNGLTTYDLDNSQFKPTQTSGTNEIGLVKPVLTFDNFTFTPVSLSAGWVWDFLPSYKFTTALTHAERAPTAAELFAFGPHLGTGAFEVGALFDLAQSGNSNHDEDSLALHYHGQAKLETSNNVDISLRKHEGELGFVVNLFYNSVDDYYIERNTGFRQSDIVQQADDHDHFEDNLPVLLFTQADTRFYGVEAEFAWQVSAPVKWTLWGDSIRGKLADGNNLPRIPPMRLGNQFNFAWRHWQAELNLVRYFDQHKFSEQETATQGYTMVDASLAYRFDLGIKQITLFAKANNLTNQDARVHSSFLKDKAPLPGRGFSLGLYGEF